MAAEAIRAYLTALREARNFSQQRAADEIGVTRVTWQKYENGKTEDPSSSFLIAAFRAFGGSFDHLRELSGRNATEELGRQLAAARAAQLSVEQAEEALKATLSADEWEAYRLEKEQRERETATRAAQEAERLSRLRSGGSR